MKYVRRFIFLIILLSISFTIYLETDLGQKQVLSSLHKILSQNIPYTVHIERIRLLFPLYLQLEGVSIDTKDEKPVLFLSSLTTIPLPIPLTNNSYYLPYLSIRSFSIHLHHVVKAAHSSEKTPISLTISRLRLMNGEVRDSHLPWPYAFSFKGKGKISKEESFLSGSLFDQTGSLPLRMAKGSLSCDSNGIKGSLACTFKKQSLMSIFQKMNLSFASAPNDPDSIKGIWNIEGPTPSQEKTIDSMAASLLGTFSLNVHSKQCSIDCSDYSLETKTDLQTLFPFLSSPSQLFSCTGSWKMEGLLRQDYSTKLVLKSFLLRSPSLTAHMEGKMTSQMKDDGCHISSSIHGTVSSDKSSSTFTGKGQTLLSPIRREALFLLTSPFMKFETNWEKDREDAKIRCSLNIDQLTKYFSNAPLNTLSLQTEYHAESEEPYHLSLSVHDLSYKGLTIGACQINTACTAITPFQGVSDIHLQQARWKKTEIETLDSQIKWDSPLIQTSLSLEGKQAQAPIKGNINFSLEQKGSLLAFECQTLSGQIGTHELSQNEPTKLSIDRLGCPQEIVSIFSIGKEGSFSIQGNPSHGTTSYTFFYDKCPLSPISLLFCDKEIQGDLSGKTVFVPGRSYPRIFSEITVNMKAPILVPEPSLHMVQCHLLAQSQNSFLETHVHVHDHTNLCDFVADYSLPMQWKPLFPYFDIDSNAPFEGTVQGKADLGVLLLPFTTDTLALSGIIDTQTTVKGSLSSPLCSGTLALHEGAFLIPKVEALLHHIEMKGSFEEAKLSIHSLKGMGGKTGTLHGEGIVSLKNHDFLWNLHLLLEKATFIEVPSLQASATGELMLTGKNDTLLITGEADLFSCTLDLSKRETNSYPKLPITYVPQSKKLMTDASQESSSITFNLRMRIDRSLFIKGRSFDTTWSGTASFEGPMNRLLSRVHATCNGGLFLFSGRKMNVEHGTIDIDGTSLNDSSIDVVAVAPLPQCTARIFLTGRLNSLSLDLRSTPVRSPREILSLLLFNKELISISPLQSLQLANTALALERKTPGSFFFDTFKNSLGIDIIDISSPELDPNEVTLSVGKYLSDGVTVTVSKDISSEANRVGVEVSITDEIKASAMIGDDAEGTLSVTWKKDF